MDSAPTTRTRSDARWLIGAAVLAFLIVAGAVPAFLVIRFPVEVLVVILAVGSVALLVLVVLASIRSQKARIEALRAAARALGLPMTYKPPAAVREGVFAPVAHLKKSLTTGAKGITWCATGHAGGRQVLLLEHQHAVSTGHTTHIVTWTVASCACPRAWPTLTLGPENVLHRLGGLLGMDDIHLESDQFNRRWRVHSGNPDYAILVLTPEVQAWLLAAPRSESWYIGYGQVTCLRRARLRPEEMAELVFRPARLLDMLPPELAAWGAAPAPRAS